MTTFPIAMSWQTIFDAYLALTPQQQLESGVVYEPHDDSSAISYYASEANRNVRAFLAIECGFVFDEHDGIVLMNENSLFNAMRVTALVSHDYEYDPPDVLDVWKSFDLGGDDDVDYNGSYIDILIDLISTIHPELPRNVQPAAHDLDMRESIARFMQ